MTFEEYTRHTCSVRIWLHQNANLSGWGFCINPNHGENIPVNRADPKNVQITSNHANC